jgi:hypothetical protein
MDWKTSNSTDGKTVRDLIGLQYFAEDDTGADMDGFDESEFLAALEGSDAEDQRGTNEGNEEIVQDGAEDQRAEEHSEEPENQPPEDGENSDAAQTAAPQTVPFKWKDTEILLPAEAVNALQSALGANPVELLQKGMNYDAKGEREFRLLDQYAEASGMSRQQYLEQLESARNEQLLSAEIEKCRAEFPETPDVALKAIAEGRMASQRAAAAQAAEQQRAELTAMQQRIDQTVEQAREEADARAWEEYVSLSGVKSFEEVPKRVLELVQQEAMTPVAAHWRYQAEQNAQAVQIEKKNNQNKMTSPGSVQGNEGDTSDPFLRGLLGL